MVEVRYKGVHDEVVVTDGEVDKTVKRGETIEVSDALAHGVPGVGSEDDAHANVGALGGLLDQEDAWELAKPPVKKAAPEAPVEEITE